MSLCLSLQKDGPLHCICMDAITSNIYVNQKFRVWKYTSYRETRFADTMSVCVCVRVSGCRDVWKIYLEQGQYERAKQYAEVRHQNPHLLSTSPLYPHPHLIFSGQSRLHGHPSQQASRKFLQGRQVSEGWSQEIKLLVVFRYQEAAISFSKSQLSFEEVALKFIQVGRTDALKTFLIKKLSSLDRKASMDLP